jgi:hypothetical protein
MQELLEHKSFDVLTDAEKQFVLEQCTAEEYQQQYEFLQHAKGSFQMERLVPSPLVQQQLQMAFANQYQSHSIWNYSIKAWWAVLGLLLISSVFAYLYFQKTNIYAPTPPLQPAVEKVFVYKTDTIYLEKITHPSIQKSTPKSTPQIEKEVPIAIQEQSENNVLDFEPILTFNDTNAVKKAENYSKGVKLDPDAPVVDVTVW